MDVWPCDPDADMCARAAGEIEHERLHRPPGSIHRSAVLFCRHSYVGLDEGESHGEDRKDAAGEAPDYDGKIKGAGTIGRKSIKKSVRTAGAQNFAVAAFSRKVSNFKARSGHCD